MTPTTKKKPNLAEKLQEMDPTRVFQITNFYKTESDSWKFILSMAEDERATRGDTVVVIAHHHPVLSPCNPKCRLVE